MVRKFRELLEKMHPERRTAIKAGADKLRAEMALAFTVLSPSKNVNDVDANKEHV